jgi:glycosyltransferase involved in cell wall biosynthesis
MPAEIKSAAILTGFHPDGYKGGIETFIVNLKALLNKYTIHVDIHSLIPEPTLPVKPFPVDFISNRVPDFLLRCYMLGKAFKHREKDYDLVISNNYYGLGYWNPTVKSCAIYHSTHAGYADALKGVVSARDYKELKYYYGHIGDRLAGRHKKKIAVSHSVKAELSYYYRFRDVDVVNHGVDTEFFTKIHEVTSLRKKWNIPADARVGLFVGRWEPGKGINILEEVIKKNRDLIWILAIGPSACPLQAENARVIQDADPGTLRELYSLSDFLLFPSLYEGFGLVLIEAIACGLPVICTAVGVAKELQQFNTLSRFILSLANTSNLIQEINSCLSSLLHKPARRQALTTAGRSVVMEYYGLEQWEQRIALALGLKCR